MRYYSSTASEKTLSSAVLSTDTEIGLNNTTGLPVSYPFTLVLDPDTASEEIVLVTGAGASKTYAVTRGTDTYQGVTGGNGTSKQAHSNGATVKHMVTARDLQEPQTHIAATSGVHGVTGSVVGTTDSQTLTNKTISSSSNTLTVSQSSVTNLTSDLALKAPLASPTFTGNVVLPSTTTIGNVSNTELAVLDGLTASTAELNLLDGVTATTTELNYVDGVTSAIQTQMDTKVRSVYANIYGTNTPNSSGPLNFGSEYFDSAGGHSTTTNTNRYTATVAGKYALSCSINVRCGADTGNFEAYFRKNGSTGISPTSSVYLPTANTSRQSISLESIVELNGSTDYVEVYFSVPSGTHTGLTVYASWNIVYVGA